MIGSFLEGAMVSASICIAVGLIASTLFPPVAIVAAGVVGGMTNATRR